MNQTLNILILEDDIITCEKFQKEIDNIEELNFIGKTASSYEALEMIKTYTPDVVIVDLELHYGEGNGLLFLQEAKKLSLPFLPYFLVTTNTSSPTTYEFARQAGADFIMYKQQKDYSEKKILDFIQMMKPIILSSQKSHNPQTQTTETPLQKQQRLKRMIATELDYLCINPKYVGYQYLRDAILLLLEGEQEPIKTILAQKYKKTPSSIERGMQNAINRAWSKTDIKVLENYYPSNINLNTGVPTITEFIYCYKEKIENNQLCAPVE